MQILSLLLFFFFNDTATTEIYTLSLHDALPICGIHRLHGMHRPCGDSFCRRSDRKSTRLNSSHSQISYAVFCLKKKKKHKNGLYLRNKKNKNDIVIQNKIQI